VTDVDSKWAWLDGASRPFCCCTAICTESVTCPHFQMMVCYCELGLIPDGVRLSRSIVKGVKFHFGYMCQRILLDRA
jgi:hypothetical protein